MFSLKAGVEVSQYQIVSSHKNASVIDIKRKWTHFYVFCVQD